MSVPAYPAYRDSGVDWIGDVPVAWSITPVRHLADCLDGQRIPLNAEQRGERSGDVPYWGANSIMDFVDEALFDEDLVLLGEDGAPFFDRTKNVAFFSRGPIWPNNHVHVLRARHLCMPAFFAFALNAVDFANYVEGSTRDKLTQQKMASIRLPLPSPPEQSAIAAFLDRETGKIDALVAEQERLIALLKEKRQAVISHAVTKGLNPDAPMKDSGVEWLGKVPAHWDVKRLKQFAGGVTVGVVVMPSQYYAHEGVPALRSLNVREMAISTDNLVYFDEASNAALAKSMLRTDDLVAIRTGKPGTTAVVGPELDGANCIDLILIRRSPRFVSRFLAYVMNSSACHIQYAAGSEGALQQHFNIETAGNLRIALPPVDDQSTITDFLDGEVGRLDVLTAEAERAIALLRERRAALISAAVTGKIDVRGLAPRAEAVAA